MTKYPVEMLTEINDNPELLLSREYQENVVIKTILQYAFDTTLKLLLPEGAPPFTKSGAPAGVAPVQLTTNVKKLYIYTRADVLPIRREQLFLQLLEGLHESEVPILLSIKDQTMHELYPNITPELVVKAGFVSQENSFRVDSCTNPANVEPVITKVGRNIVVNLTESVDTKESFEQPKEVVVESVEEVKSDEPDVKPKRGRGRPKKA
jgi:hypothetical protein